MATTSMDFASVIATFTPKAEGLSPIVFKADVFFNEEEFLSEPQPDKDRARLFMSNDGSAGQYIDLFAIAGKRDIKIFDGDAADKLNGWAFANPQPVFDLAFLYRRNSASDSEARINMHLDCKFINHPARAMSNDIATIKFSFKYARLQILNGSGEPVS